MDFHPLLAWRYGTFQHGKPDAYRLAGALSPETLREDVVPEQHRQALSAWRAGDHDPIAACRQFLACK